jgi:beta-alanine--pyruvate transaminase
MGAVFVSRAVHDALMQGPPDQIELFHGYTYSGHPAACAAGLATLDIYKRENLLTRGAKLAPEWEALMHGLKGQPHVADVRTLGLVAGIELSPRPGAPGARGYEIYLKCFHEGLLIRVTGDIIALSPPLILEKDHMETMAAKLANALRQIA